MGVFFVQLCETGSHSVALRFPSFTLLSTSIPSQNFFGGGRRRARWSKHSLSCSLDGGGMIRLGCKFVAAMTGGWLTSLLVSHRNSLLRGADPSLGNAQLLVAPLTYSFLPLCLPPFFSRETDNPLFRKASHFYFLEWRIVLFPWLAVLLPQNQGGRRMPEQRLYECLCCCSLAVPCQISVLASIWLCLCAFLGRGA